MLKTLAIHSAIDRAINIVFDGISRNLSVTDTFSGKLSSIHIEDEIELIKYTMYFYSDGHQIRMDGIAEECYVVDIIKQGSDIQLIFIPSYAELTYYCDDRDALSNWLPDFLREIIVDTGSAPDRFQCIEMVDGEELEAGTDTITKIV